MSKVNWKLKEFTWTVLCISILLSGSCKLLITKPAKSDNTNIKRDITKTDNLPEGKDEIKNGKSTIGKDVPAIKENITREVIPAKQGAGYLSEGSAISLGVMDGDEEIKVLKKIQRLEARLEAERNKLKAFEEKLSELQAAKESVEKDFTDTRNKLEERISELLSEIKALESKLKDTESRAVTAEQELKPIKKELLKSQISDTRAQQELYKLKIENLKQDDK